MIFANPMRLRLSNPCYSMQGHIFRWLCPLESGYIDNRDYAYYCIWVTDSHTIQYQQREQYYS